MSAAQTTADAGRTDNDLLEFVTAIGDVFEKDPKRDRYGRAIEPKNYARLVALAQKYRVGGCFDTAEQAGEVARAILAALIAAKGDGQ